MANDGIDMYNHNGLTYSGNMASLILVKKIPNRHDVSKAFHGLERLKRNREQLPWKTSNDPWSYRDL